MIFYRRLLILISFVFSDYSYAKDLTIMFNSNKDVDINICNKFSLSNVIHVHVNKNSWYNTLTFDDNFLNEGSFCSNNRYDSFSSIISGDNKGDDTICCMISDDGTVNYCVYNNSFPGYFPSCK